jgi:hypothetical protein
VQFPITIGLRRSRFVAGFRLLLVGFALASLVVLFAARSWSWLPLLPAILFFFAWLRFPLPVGELFLLRSGELHYRPCTGFDWVAVTLLPGGVVHPWLTVLPLEFPDGRAKVLILAVDSLSQPDFRRLRIFLRWRASAVTSCSGGA